MAKKTTTEAVQTIVAELTPFESLDRQRIIQACLMLLGESAAKIQSRVEVASPDETLPGEVSALPVRARTWLKQNGLSIDQLKQVFHVEGENVEVIAAEIPGKTNREKVRNAYVLTGLAQLLATGEPKFQDKAARTLCETSGFYDHTNHSKYLKGGNEFAGSKSGGLTVTSPGLKLGASLVLELSKDA